MHGNVVLEGLKGERELLRVVEDVEANEEMCCRDVVGLEEVIKFVRGLRNQMYE